MLQTEYEFNLPNGFIDPEGNLHKEGVMRLATAADEIVPLKDPRVQNNPAYLLVLLLSRVVTRLGSIELINPKVVEGMFAGDLAYLQEFYNRINGNGTRSFQVNCPHCQQAFQVEIDQPGES
jgi:hypothetical protein